MESKPTTEAKEPAKAEETEAAEDPQHMQSFQLFTNLLRLHREVKDPSGQNLASRLLKNEILNLNLSEQERLYFESLLYVDKEEEMRSELRAKSLDIDFGAFEFQKKFYQRYALTRHGGGSEALKASELAVPVGTMRKVSVLITRARLDELLTKFRRIYASFCQAKSFLTDSAAKSFDESFEFEIFTLIEEQVSERLVIDGRAVPFAVRWERHPLDADKKFFADEAAEAALSEDYLRACLLSLLKSNLYAALKALTGVYDLPNEKIAQLFFQEHIELFEYFLKNVKVVHLNKLHQEEDRRRCESEREHETELSAEWARFQQEQLKPPKDKDKDKEKPPTGKAPDAEPPVEEKKPAEPAKSQKKKK